MAIKILVPLSAPFLSPHLINVVIPAGYVLVAPFLVTVNGSVGCCHADCAAEAVNPKKCANIALSSLIVVAVFWGLRAVNLALVSAFIVALKSFSVLVSCNTIGVTVVGVNAACAESLNLTETDIPVAVVVYT